MKYARVHHTPYHMYYISLPLIHTHTHSHTYLLAVVAVARVSAGLALLGGSRSCRRGALGSSQRRILVLCGLGGGCGRGGVALCVV
jgi:hypothetical protein